ncbi:MAG: hypothetical protein BWX98_01711 [Candidatus Aminicenantes bacterium ADurb.Bin147]|nr:MAG: hypothetical protein BWX98_01711 [Candidatus Aminicenantes bacterium ADurb.Bin147]
MMTDEKKNRLDTVARSWKPEAGGRKIEGTAVPSQIRAYKDAEAAKRRGTRTTTPMMTRYKPWT